MIRFARKDDFTQISMMLKEIHAMHANAETEYYKELEEVMSEPDYQKEVEKNHIIVLDEEKIIKGYVIFAEMKIQNHLIIKDQKILMIDDICVLSTERRKGIGRQLFCEIEKYAKKEKYTSIDLNVWTFNIGAHEFYKSMGMRDTRIRMTKYINQDV